MAGEKKKKSDLGDKEARSYPIYMNHFKLLSPTDAEEALEGDEDE